MVGHEAPGTVHAPGCLPAARQHPQDMVEQGQMLLGKVQRFRRPVVHLRIDVDGVLTVPGRGKGRVPEALQIGRQGAGTGGGQEKIAAEGKIIAHQLQIFTALRKAAQPLVRG